MGDDTGWAEARLKQLLHDQSDVVSRRQVLECGLDSAFVRRRLRRREWVAVYDGVYVTHTGPMTWTQRAWCAILYAAPSALSHESALFSHTGDGDGRGPIHIAVKAHRSLRGRPGLVIHYRADFDDAVARLDPPRIRLDETVLDLASTATSKVDVIAVLSGIVGARRTTAERLLAALDRRERARHSAFIRAVLHDVRDGTCSVLEHGYLTKVERAHGLPAPTRQAPTCVGRSGLRDADYPDWGVIVELDGRLGHDDAVSRDRDMERDLDATVLADRTTLRVGFGQVHDRPCSTAQKVGIELSKGGWPGRLHACRLPDCLLRAA
ncbi:hypothetical protein L5I01_33175 [Gordonia sp. HY442]|uniref:hypothetical protein n=1 Tax=Gordonia zhenghanii TaxID=2911516 RepID=UPI001F2BD7AB|nr:hypothetical protein [Gordonia zhenghanii]MCF8608215.1 hypothetical protein [Gordonia zhenghanii]